MKFGIGQAVPRTEDLRLLTGRGRYLEDINLPGQAHAAVLRSPHAHARIAAIDRQTGVLPSAESVTGKKVAASILTQVQKAIYNRPHYEPSCSDYNIRIII